MVELGIKQYKGLSDFKNEKIGTCVKPCLIFNGPKWNQTEELRRLKSLFIDTFHRDTVSFLKSNCFPLVFLPFLFKVDAIRLQGIEHVISLTVTEDNMILLRSYKILLKKSGVKTPRIELNEIGPSMDMTIRRTKIASDDLYKLARKQPRQLKTFKKKNIVRDNLGTTRGRVHVGRQKIASVQTRKVRALRKTPEEKKAKRQVKKADARKAKAAAVEE